MTEPIAWPLILKILESAKIQMELAFFANIQRNIAQCHFLQLRQQKSPLNLNRTKKICEK